MQPNFGIGHNITSIHTLFITLRRWNNYVNKDDDRTMPDVVKIINDYNIAALIQIGIKNIYRQ